MASVLLKDVLAKKNLLDKFTVTSAGLAVQAGSKASENALKVMDEIGLDLYTHEACQVTPEKLAAADLILTMTCGHKKVICHVMPELSNKAYTLKEFVGNSMEDMDIIDPFGGTVDIYRQCAQELEALLIKTVEKIIRSEQKMKLAIASDHGGFVLKEYLKEIITESGWEYVDLGPQNDDSVDYPDFAIKVAEGVAEGKYARGILVCGTGIGMSIAANKVPGIRAALCHDTFSAQATREHNDSNILALGERVVGKGLATEIVKIWLKTDFAGGRHQGRVEKIKEIEEKYRK